MVIVAVIVVALVVYLFARRAEQTSARQAGLRHFTHDHYLSETSDDAWDTWRIDLVDMTATVRRFTPDSDSWSSDPLPVRRSQSGRWSVQNKNDDGSRKWQRIPDDVSRVLEPHYQRFVAQWRG